MIPRNPDDVTADWLSGVLGTEVRTLELNPIGTGQTGATYRLSVGYTDEVGLPASFAIKLPSQDDGVRDRVAIGYRSEHAFYRDVADLVSIPVPHSYYCEIEDEGAEFALLLADLAPAEQGDQIAGCSSGDALLAVRALAGLHAPSWCDPKWTDFPGIAMPRPDEDMAFGMGEVAKMASAITLEKLGARMTAADRDTMEAALSVVTPWLLAEPDRFALLHGDYRLDNMLFDPGHTEITIVDWQTLGSGLPARDLSYFTATSLDPDIRAQAEDQLVDAYHGQLLALGVTGYSRETCWRDYRLGMLQAPLIIAFGTAFASSTDRGDEMMLAMATRSCAAIRELDTLALI
ncbi:phosphotransferase family protein [Mycolicibacterium fluoranthenivorans]|uniref:Aminoglycoside phosphotransferase (APT) family kinase protein n=1 Tax=Mycolicibacterium fluoranthenivorans TaxID=258505 RepID=A0A7X5U0J3_9MYCO|nr:aminoglycoside phosphotransferase family protein [Mycolicibacterium fluoranthenivorans]MCV7357745.1 aminoglycoside phosphotransferase family protein [Mycolicibacterium fluoranthenivorans]NIH96139.1 aminoglycoside phosphotransferase (APT) family kinase protein [Mycolicibacterium fluoranthenivorans]